MTSRCQCQPRSYVTGHSGQLTAWSSHYNHSATQHH